MDLVLIDVAEGIATVTLNDPGAGNAVGYAMAREIVAALTEAENSARAVLLTGSGRAFCTGFNLKEAAREPNGDRMRATFDPIVTKLRELKVASVVALNGAAAGFGASIALMGDLIVAAEQAYILQAFRHVGLVPDGNMTYILPRRITFARAMELVLRGERLAAGKALEWGLINEVVPADRLMERARELAGEAAHGPASIALIRQAMWRALDNAWDEQLALEARNQIIAANSEDCAEGIAAFMERRPPRFTGR